MGGSWFCGSSGGRLWWEEVAWGILGKLESSDVGDNGPAIFDLNMVVGPHLPFPVGDGVEYFPIGHGAIFVCVIAGGTNQSVLGCNAVPCASGAVANLAINLIPFLAAGQKFLVDGYRNPCSPHRSHLASDKIRLVGLDMERNAAVRRDTIDASLGEKGGGGLRLVFRLAIHIGKDFDRSIFGEVTPKSGDGHDGKSEGAENREEDANKTLHETTSEVGRAGCGVISGS